MNTASAAETTTLGMTGREVSRIAFGTWQLGGDWWGSFDEAEAIRRRCLAGALRDELVQHRDQLVVATRGGLRMAGDPAQLLLRAAWGRLARAAVRPTVASSLCSAKWRALT